MSSVSEKSFIKSRLVNTSAYRTLLEARSLLQSAKISMHRRQPVDRTSYCISPYKTGTTYLTGLFEGACRVAHEPFMHPTIKNISNVEFLRKRNSLLGLDLECSGFFAGKLDVIREVSPQAPVLYLIRSPEVWMGSVVNYFSGLNKKMSYNYVARMIFDPICGHPVDGFYELNDAEQSQLVSRLLDFWVNVYQQAYTDRNALIVSLDTLDDRLEEVSQFLRLPVPKTRSAWRRMNVDKKYFSLGDYVDLSAYREPIRKMGFDV